MGWTAIAFALAIGALAGAFNGLGRAAHPGDRRDARYAGVVSRGDVAVDRREMDRRLARQPEIASEPAFIGVSPLAGWCCCWAGGWLLSRTAFGRDFYAVGDNSRRASSWAWRSTARGCWPLPSTVCWRPAPGSSSPRRLVLCLIRPAAAGDESHRRLRAGRDPLLGGTGTLLGAFSAPFSSPKLTPYWYCSAFPPGGTTLSPPVLLGVLVLDGRLRQALARHQRALKYSRFQPGNKGETGCPLS